MKTTKRNLQWVKKFFDYSDSKTRKLLISGLTDKSLLARLGGKKGLKKLVNEIECKLDAEQTMLQQQMDW